MTSGPSTGYNLAGCTDAGQIYINMDQVTIGNQEGIHRNATQARDIHPMLAKCWAGVVDSDPALSQHWQMYVVYHTGPASQLIQCWLTVGPASHTVTQD